MRSDIPELMKQKGIDCIVIPYGNTFENSDALYLLGEGAKTISGVILWKLGEKKPFFICNQMERESVHRSEKIL